ncbi:ABC transporter permease subunit [Bacillaceae bacterium Marseille-Q3522]|nr:ABC transporter permease subunit [Bacillaceae bacterium Marseille-Q3522]
MTEFVILLKKEMLEMWRSYKFLWMPVLFLILGMMQPLSSYYLPDLLEAFGGLPEGTVLEIPLPSAEEVFVLTLGQFSQVGVIVIVLALMGMFAGERSSGTAVMVLVKPVSYAKYFLAKWAAASMLIIGSYLIGVAAAFYYIDILFTGLPVKEFFLAISIYGLWLLFIVSLTLFFSTLLKRTGAIAAVSLIIIIGQSIVTSVLHDTLSWTPGALSLHAQEMIMGVSAEGLSGSLISSILLVVLMICGGVFYIRKGYWLQK